MNVTARRTALAITAIIVLLGGAAPALAYTQPQQLNLTSNPMGGVTDLGAQTYTVAGGQVVFALINGVPLSNPSLQYGFVASENTGVMSGAGAMRLTGTLSGQSITISGNFGIDDAQFIASAGYNALPGYFISDSPNLNVNTGGNTQRFGLPLAIETPYANPFGGPIVMYSGDCLIPNTTSCYLTIVTTYNIGTIYWQGSQVSGPVTGTLGSTPVSGTASNSGNEFENLVTGYAIDQGTTTFTGFAIPSLNGNGNYHGTSTIPPGGQDCSSALTGIDYPVPTCMYTGFQSSGHWALGQFRGTYSTTWTSPAFAFTTQLQGSASQNSNSGFGFGSFGGLSGLFGFLSNL